MPAGLTSWGGVFAPQARALPYADRSQPLPTCEAKLLAYGGGRSYGDVCLNHGHVVLDTRGLGRFIALDAEAGVLRCEAGVSLAEVIALALPRGWFPAVVPGTRGVTVGGAIANDVHGKNHHRDGSFGNHVRRFELLRSDGTRRTCSRTENEQLFRATIGGLGLTGLVTWAEIALARVPGPWIAQSTLRFASLDAFFEAEEALQAAHPHVVAWVDCGARTWGRGILFAGTPAAGPATRRVAAAITLPATPPFGLVTRASVGAFNALYYRAHPTRAEPRLIDYARFFFPLDRIGAWNRAYGPRGFFQHQSIVPADDAGRAALRQMLRESAEGGHAAFLGVLKRMGERPAEGMLSFPRPGYTLALDFPNTGEAVLAHLARLDAIALDAGGRLYPAKDARMSPASFERSFPCWREFSAHVDPAFSSSFWRRVTAGEAPRFAMP